MNKTIFILYYILLGVLTANGQEEKGSILFHPYPIEKEIYVKTNDTLFSHPKITLPPGKYDFSIWAPKHEVFDSSIVIIKDSLLRLRFFLPYSEAFNNYLIQKRKYSKSVIIPKVISFSVSGLLTIGTGLAYFNTTKQWDKVLISEENYNRSNLVDVQLNRERAESEIKKYNRLKKTTYILGISTLISYCINIWIVQSKKNRKKPTYEYETSPFEVSILHPESTNQIGTIGLGLNYKF